MRRSGSEHWQHWGWGKRVWWQRFHQCRRLEADRLVLEAGLGRAVRRGGLDDSLLGRLEDDRVESFGCPRCSSADVCRWGRASGKPRYRCAACCRTFNPLTGMPLAGLRYKERWAAQAQALIAGKTVSKAAARCKIAYTTVFRWRHRFLAALNLDKPQHLSGIVEADETFILESFKGKRGKLWRAARKRGGKASKRGLSHEQIAVVVARDRSGALSTRFCPVWALPA
jgi:transposase-like protein